MRSLQQLGRALYDDVAGLVVDDGHASFSVDEALDDYRAHVAQLTAQRDELRRRIAVLGGSTFTTSDDGDPW